MQIWKKLKKSSFFIILLKNLTFQTSKGLIWNELILTLRIKDFVPTKWWINKISSLVISDKLWLSSTTFLKLAFFQIFKPKIMRLKNPWYLTYRRVNGRSGYLKKKNNPDHGISALPRFCFRDVGKSRWELGIFRAFGNRDFLILIPKISRNSRFLGPA